MAGLEPTISWLRVQYLNHSAIRPSPSKWFVMFGLPHIIMPPKTHHNRKGNILKPSIFFEKIAGAANGFKWQGRPQDQKAFTDILHGGMTQPPKDINSRLLFCRSIYVWIIILSITLNNHSLCVVSAYLHVALSLTSHATGDINVVSREGCHVTGDINGFNTCTSYYALHRWKRSAKRVRYCGGRARYQHPGIHLLAAHPDSSRQGSGSNSRENLFVSADWILRNVSAWVCERN